jgi:DNA-binding transcriptional LysR family regulator
MMNTDLRHVRHVVALAKHLSFTRAAKELDITQSALTRSIQAIEQRAGTRLFDRDRGRVSLTEVGGAYVRRAEVLLQDADDLDRLLHQTVAGDVGEVHFGLTSALARALLPEILVEQLAHRPQLRELIRIATPKALTEMVQREELEFCVCGELSPQPQSLRRTIIGNVSLSMIVRNGHPLPRDVPTLDLTPYPLLLSGQASDAARVGEMLRPLILGPPSIVLDDLGLLIHLVTNSDAVWLTSTVAVAAHLRSGRLRELPMPPEAAPRFRAVLYSHERRTLSPAARRLTDLMRSQAARWSGGDP